MGYTIEVLSVRRLEYQASMVKPHGTGHCQDLVADRSQGRTGEVVGLDTGTSYTAH
ncbi:MAG: hypothetical protein ACYCU8_09305 [Ferrimicrobium acidiphilum]